MAGNTTNGETVSKGERIPQPEGWGAFTSAYWKRGSGSPKSPNRKVGDLSSRCISRCSGLAVKNPQPPGWGFHTVSELVDFSHSAYSFTSPFSRSLGFNSRARPRGGARVEALNLQKGRGSGPSHGRLGLRNPPTALGVFLKNQIFTPCRGLWFVQTGLTLRADSNFCCQSFRTFIRRAGSIPKFSTSIEPPLIAFTFAA